MFRVAKISARRSLSHLTMWGRGLKIHDAINSTSLRSRVLTENGTGLKPEL